MNPFTIALVASAGIQVYSSIMQGNAQQKAYEAEAQAKRNLAGQIMKDFEINAGLTKKEGARFIKNQQASFVGVDVGSGAPLMAMEDSMSALQEQISMDRRNALAKANAALAGADISKQAGKDAITASRWQVLSQVGQTAIAASRPTK